MRRITTSTRAINLFGAGKDGFRDGDRAQGIAATALNAEFFNAVQEELLYIIEQAGLTAGAETTQLRQAIALMIAAGAVAAASETVSGRVELATAAETLTGTDSTRATHPAGVKNAIDTAIAALVASSPAALNTLNELAAALGNDANFAATMTAALGAKQNSATAVNQSNIDGYLDTAEFSYGKGVYDVLAARASGVTYTAPSGYSLFVSINRAMSASGSHQLIVGGITVGSALNGFADRTINANLCAIVPPGVTYSTTGSGTINHWTELRS